MKHANILVVDDEPLILKTIAAYLVREGFDFRTASTGKEALKVIETFPPDYVILDLMLPEMSGQEFLKQLRRFSDAQVTVLSARNNEHEKVELLYDGADDYVVKPFSTRELVAKVKAYFRRRNRQILMPELAHLGTLVVDRAKREVLNNGELIDLTHTECDILAAFIENPGHVLSRGRLIEMVWGNEFYIEERAIDVHVRRLRTKIEKDPAHPEIVVTSRGSGYRLGDIELWYD